MPVEPSWMWTAFFAFIALMLWLDLGVFNKKSHSISIRESLMWTGIWISLALLFNVGIFFYFGKEKALEFLTGYVIEESLSVDNLFVILLIFSYFKVQAEFQHKVLFWGILGALAMRMVLILVGIELLEHFHWLMYVFGGFLLFTGVRMLFGEEKEFHPEENPVVKLFKRFFTVSNEYHGDKFFVRNAGKLIATPLFVVVLVVELTDLVFAMDSIPAILAVTQDRFVVYTSNAFAILGLRSLFFALAAVMNLFYYIKYGLAIVLSFIGVKMLIVEFYKIPIGLSLSVVVGVLAASVLYSIFFPKKEKLEEVQ